MMTRPYLWRALLLTIALLLPGVLSVGPAAAASGPGGVAPANCADPALPMTAAYRTLPGVPVEQTSLDVYTPQGAACAAPVVMWVHGGAYSSGDKANQIGDKAALFMSHGWLLVSVNYRLTVPGDPDSAHYPDHFSDVAAAVAWVHDHIAGYGGNPDKVALLGHSAGADIVSNVADDPKYLAAHGLGLSALRCAGPLDTEGFDKTTAEAAEQAQWQEAFGNHPDYPSDTSATLFAAAGTGIPPTIGVYRGTANRQRIEQAYLGRLAELGVPATTIDARGLSHAEVNSRIGAPGDDRMTPPLMSFLDFCFSR